MNETDRLIEDACGRERRMDAAADARTLVAAEAWVWAYVYGSVVGAALSAGRSRFSARDDAKEMAANAVDDARAAGLFDRVEAPEE